MGECHICLGPSDVGFMMKCKLGCCDGLDQECCQECQKLHSRFCQTLSDADLAVLQDRHNKGKEKQRGRSNPDAEGTR